MRRTASTRSISTRPTSRSCPIAPTAAASSDAVAFSSDGNTLLAAIGPGSVTGDGKANAIVALDPRTLQLKDWFTQPTAEFVTGPTVFRHGTKDVVAAATKDGRVILLDVGVARRCEPRNAAAGVAVPRCERWLDLCGGAGDLGACGRRAARSRLRGAVDSRPDLGQAVGRSRDQRCDPQRRCRRPPRGGGQRCVLARSLSGRPTISTTPATPIIVNGVVFALSTGRPAAAGRPDRRRCSMPTTVSRARRSGTAASR